MEIIKPHSEPKTLQQEKKDALYKLIQQARDQNKWINFELNDHWLSPDEMEAAIKKDQYIFDIRNFSLRDPAVLVMKVEQLLKEQLIGSANYYTVKQHLKNIKDRIAESNQIKN